MAPLAGLIRSTSAPAVEVLCSWKVCAPARTSCQPVPQVPVDTEMTLPAGEVPHPASPAASTLADSSPHTAGRTPAGTRPPQQESNPAVKSTGRIPTPGQPAGTRGNIHRPFRERSYTVSSRHFRSAAGPLREGPAGGFSRAGVPPGRGCGVPGHLARSMLGSQLPSTSGCAQAGGHRVSSPAPDQATSSQPGPQGPGHGPPGGGQPGRRRGGIIRLALLCGVATLLLGAIVAE